MRRFSPAPGTFAEGQRLIYAWLAAAAGMFCGAAAAMMVCLLMWGGWSSGEEHTIVLTFGWTLGALDSFLTIRGASSGETVLLRALEALQGERYLRLAERRPANEAFLYGWLANRIGEQG